MEDQINQAQPEDAAAEEIGNTETNASVMPPEDAAVEEQTETNATDAGDVETAIAAERTRTAAINEALAGTEFDALRKKALAEGLTVDEAKAAAEEQTETNATDGETDRQLQPGVSVRIHGGGAGYISQISTDGKQVRVAEPIPDDRHGRVGKRWVPAADVEAGE